jgi:HPt (histidine-containing phosphotransfer) domain-containing protein
MFFIMRDLINLAHLDEQTFGDQALCREVLEMFQVQTPLLINALLAAEGIGRSDIAHRLKGSCLAIGAIELSNVATIIEDDPLASLDIRPLAEATLQEVAKLLQT